VHEQVAGACLERVTSSTRPPVMTVVLAYAGDFSVVEATYLGASIIAAYSSPWPGHTLA
jgi:hypothetical protein